MAKTITLPAELPAHPIFLSLHEARGPDGCWHLVKLLAWAAIHRPDGNLSGMSHNAIAQAAGWSDYGDVQSLAYVLHKAGALVGDLAEVNQLRISPDLLPKKARGDDNAPPCPVEKIVEAYHESLPMLARVRTLSSNTRASVVRAWKAEPERQTIEWWRQYFGHVAKRCPFLIGKVNTSVFYADFAWLIGPKNMEKVINGRFDA